MLRIAALLLAFLLISPLAEAQEKLKVVASFSILADMARQIGGEDADVQSIVPPLGDAHVFQPSPGDARRLAEAKLLLSSGLGFEPWLDRLVSASGFKGRRVVASKGIKPRRMIDNRHGATLDDDDDDGDAGHGHDHAVTDPHIWQDPSRMARYVANIADGFAAADPARAAAYRARAGAYAAEIAALDAWATQQFAAVPRAQRKAVSQHDAFGYLAERYKIDFYAPQGISSAGEASAEGVATLLRQIRQFKIQAIFFESIAPPRLIERVAKEAGVKVGGKLYTDALDPPGGAAQSYLAMMRLNVERLTEAMRRD